MELSEMLKALGDPTRLSIFLHLLERRHCVRSLSRKTGITESAVSQHMKILRGAGLVCGEKYGYHTHYYPRQEALEMLAERFAAMRDRSDALDRAPGVCQCEFKGEDAQ